MRQEDRKSIFHITVGTTPTQTRFGEPTNLIQELRLLKAALLYADKVKFCSVASSFMIMLYSVGSLSGDQILEIFADAKNNEQLKQGLETYRTLSKKKRRNKIERMAYKQLRSGFRQFEHEAKVFLETMALDAGVGDLETAFKTGLVEIQIFDSTDTNQIATDYFDLVAQSVLSGDTYPLFDDATGQLLNAAIREGILKPSNISVNRAKQVGLSSNLLSRLPLFDDVPFGEIIDIRNELDKSLTRFRSAIISFSDEIENGSWDEDFPQEAERVFIKYVEPSILEIEDACKSNRLLLSLIPNLVNKPTIPVSGSALAILLAEAQQIPDIVAGGLGFAAGASTVILETVNEWRKKNTEIEGNQLYFYYKAGKMMETGTKNR